MSGLYLVYRQRTATNPHARNWSAPFSLPKSMGNRHHRRKLVASLRTKGTAAQ